PVNDLCSGAISLTPTNNCVTTTGSFSGSGNIGTTTSCFSTALQDVWYSFVATDPTMSISLSNGVGVNLGMEIITGSCSGTSFVCDNSSTSSVSEFYQNNTFTVGQTYFVRVFHAESSLLTTNFTICVQNYPTPVNDLCSGAISLTPTTNCVTTTGSFSGSGNIGTTTSCFSTALQDVWYSFVATDPTMSISLSNGVGVNLGMEIITGSCSGTSFVCDNSSTSSVSEFYQNNTFTVGQTYYVRVFHAESSLLTTNFTICIQNPSLSTTEYIVDDIKIYPNPTTDFIDIETNLNVKEISLYTISGQLILSSNQKRVLTSNLPKGIYLLKLEDENGNIATKRIVKN
ncbi:T9SS type A sorting domain-containing protein, partial [Flavobacterium sp.]|uniref:T9SS type A sorting domain-containing protein n=1 Tax=Flavobacterium sp. TaxID=239 RepID=UPI0037BF02F0